MDEQTSNENQNSGIIDFMNQHNEIINSCGNQTTEVTNLLRNEHNPHNSIEIIPDDPSGENPKVNAEVTGDKSSDSVEKSFGQDDIVQNGNTIEIFDESVEKPLESATENTDRNDVTENRDVIDLVDYKSDANENSDIELTSSNVLKITVFDTQKSGAAKTFQCAVTRNVSDEEEVNSNVEDCDPEKQDVIESEAATDTESRAGDREILITQGDTSIIYTPNIANDAGVEPSVDQNNITTPVSLICTSKAAAQQLMLGKVH